jgi:hypothetical protein
MKFVQNNQLVVGLAPYDMGAGAGVGDFVSLKLYRRIAIVLAKAAGYAGQSPVLTIQQAKDVAGTGAKALNFTEYAAKTGAQTGVGTFTRSTQTAANTLAAVGGSQELIVVEFDAEELDVNGGFTCVRASLSDPGSTEGGSYGTLLYILSDPRYSGETMPSAIVD